MEADISADKYQVITRDFAASPEQVWACWTEPERLRAWYAQNPFDVSVCTIDLRVGGRMFLGMHWRRQDGKEGTTYCGGNYVEIVPDRRLVMSGFFADKDGNEVAASDYGATVWPDEVEMFIDLEPHNGGTRMTYRETVLPIPLQDKWANERFDKLAAHLREMGQ